MRKSRWNLALWALIGAGLGVIIAALIVLLAGRGGDRPAATLAATTTATSAAPATLPPTSAPPTTANAGTTTAAPTTTTLPPPAAYLEAICREAWGAGPLTSEPPTHTIDRLTVHHAAVLFGSNTAAPARVLSYQRYHQDSGFADIAYHFIIDAHGHVYFGRPVQYRGETFTDYDTTGHFLVIVDGHFDEQSVPDAQLGALVDLLAWASEEFGVSLDTIAGHRDYAATSCPGDSLYALLPEVRARAEERVAAGGVELVPVCGEEADALISSIEAGTDTPWPGTSSGG